MERNHTRQKVQRIFRPHFNFARYEPSQHFIADLFPTILSALNGLNDKPVMSKSAQFAKLIELRKNLGWENQNRRYRRDLLKDFLAGARSSWSVLMFGGLSFGFLNCH